MSSIGYPHFLRVVNTPDTKFLLWQTDHYKYRIEMFDRGDMSLQAAVNYNTSYEHASKEFEALTEDVR